MGLTPHASISAFEIAVYAILLPACIWNCIRFGFNRHSGWLFLTVHCIIRIVGSAIYIDVAQTRSTNVGLIMAAQIMLNIALGPLISAALAFCNISHARHGAFRELPLMKKAGRLMHLAVLVAIILSAVGNAKRFTDKEAKSIDTDVSLVRAGACLLLAALVFTTLLFAGTWRQRREFADLQRKLVPAMLVALPLLYVRVVYSLLGAFNLDTSSGRGHTQKFSSGTNGSWVLFLILGALTQLAVVAAWTVAGLMARKEEGNGDYKGHSQTTELESGVGTKHHFPTQHHQETGYTGSQRY